MPHPSPAEERRSFLPLILGTITLGGILFFLVLISGGFFLYVLLGTGAIAMVALFHYLTWGSEMNRDTEGEREEARIQDEIEGDPW
jgi:hypothetical protein